MASVEILKLFHENLIASDLLDLRKAENEKPGRGLPLEKQLELLENITGNVSNRKARRWLNDRLLMELVPRMNGEEIRGLFAPPPFGDEVPPSLFTKANGGNWDKFRSIDMDKEANILDTLSRPSAKSRGRVDADKMDAINAWRRIDCKTREALRRSFLTELIQGYEACVRSYIQESVDDEVLTLQVQDPFHRLLLHGVCEFYNLVSVTVSDAQSLKTTRIKKKTSPANPPNITLSHFLKMTKEGLW